jgi:hypothetical protein
MLHSNALIGDIHYIHNWVYADKIARLAAVGLTSDDVGKAAYQLSDKTHWILVSESPVQWKQLTAETLEPSPTQRALITKPAGIVTNPASRLYMYSNY